MNDPRPVRGGPWPIVQIDWAGDVSGETMRRARILVLRALLIGSPGCEAQGVLSQLDSETSELDTLAMVHSTTTLGCGGLHLPSLRGPDPFKAMRTQHRETGRVGRAISSGRGHLILQGQAVGQWSLCGTLKTGSGRVGSPSDWIGAWLGERQS